jgi:dihydroorotase
MVAAGAVAISDDGQPVMNAQLMRRAMEYAADLDVPVVDHCEDRNLAAGGSMNEGCCSARLGLKGINRVAEEVQVARDCLLAELTGASVHIAHISTARSVELVKAAKARGARITCEVTPHHFVLTEDAVGEFDTSCKMNPPLRAEDDRAALVDAIVDGTIDCIATDHAPHAAIEKAETFDKAPFGIVGLETSLGLSYTALVATGLISVSRLIELMSSRPSELFKLGRGSLAVGAPADAVVFDDSSYEIRASQLASKSKNTPFGGWRLQGRVLSTVYGGNIVFQRPSES